MTTAPALDACIAETRAALALDAPQVLCLLATGASLLLQRSPDARSVPLGGLAGVPTRWSGAVLHHGTLGGTRVWAIEDSADEPGSGEPDGSGKASGLGASSPAWSAGYPCWLAAAAGAKVLVHGWAGAELPDLHSSQALAPGQLVLATDHLNLSGSSPLVGLGPTPLGPLFPDLTELHDRDLRSVALARATALGLAASEAVVACVRGPSLVTPAEARYFATAGAGVCVPGLADPLLAAGHAGLRVLAVIALGAQAGETSDVATIVARAHELAPAVEDLVVEIAPDLGARARELSEEQQ